ncbi:hypothetical protein [Streptomyces sp. NPDC058695]|uniref:hypothetical protein n=1 Tax=Streptomyces sp. NPDC058695 TaxID=3346604 RepID=UPI00366666BD
MYRKTLGLFTHYDLGNKQPLVGRTAPDFRFEDGTRLGNLKTMSSEDGLEQTLAFFNSGPTDRPRRAVVRREPAARLGG